MRDNRLVTISLPFPAAVTKGVQATIDSANKPILGRSVRIKSGNRRSFSIKTCTTPVRMAISKATAECNRVRRHGGDMIILRS